MLRSDDAVSNVVLIPVTGKLIMRVEDVDANSSLKLV